jgi:hypothetical protein
VKKKKAKGKLEVTEETGANGHLIRRELSRARGSKRPGLMKTH